uniref:Uncharacterized protein n=1 Tax=Arundo donax TaxID=35708 RepID=A0A0A9HP88_ARUDO
MFQFHITVSVNTKAVDYKMELSKTRIIMWCFT